MREVNFKNSIEPRFTLEKLEKIKAQLSQNEFAENYGDLYRYFVNQKERDKQKQIQKEEKTISTKKRK